MPIYALTMLVAGIGIPLLAALNAALGRAHRVSGGCRDGAVLRGPSGNQHRATLDHWPKSADGQCAACTKALCCWAGLLVAFYVLSITCIAPHFGIGNAVFFVLSGSA